MANVNKCSRSVTVLLLLAALALSWFFFWPDQGGGDSGRRGVESRETSEGAEPVNALSTAPASGQRNAKPEQTQRDKRLRAGLVLDGFAGSAVALQSELLASVGPGAEAQACTKDAQGVYQLPKSCWGGLGLLWIEPGGSADIGTCRVLVDENGAIYALDGEVAADDERLSEAYRKLLSQKSRPALNLAAPKGSKRATTSAPALVALRFWASATILVEDQDGLPLAGAKVKIVDIATHASGAEVHVGKSERLPRTDDRGETHANAIRPGEATIVVVCAGYTQRVANQQHTFVAREEAKVRFVFEANFTLFGVVRDAEGNPVEGALIEAIKHEEGRDHSVIGGNTGITHRTRSDAQGRYRLPADTTAEAMTTRHRESGLFVMASHVLHGRTEKRLHFDQPNLDLFLQPHDEAHARLVLEGLSDALQAEVTLDVSGRPQPKGNETFLAPSSGNVSSVTLPLPEDGRISLPISHGQWEIEPKLEGWEFSPSVALFVTWPLGTKPAPVVVQARKQLPLRVTLPRGHAGGYVLVRDQLGQVPNRFQPVEAGQQRATVQTPASAYLVGFISHDGRVGRPVEVRLEESKTREVELQAESGKLVSVVFRSDVHPSKLMHDGVIVPVLQPLWSGGDLSGGYFRLLSSREARIADVLQPRLEHPPVAEMRAGEAVVPQSWVDWGLEVPTMLPSLRTHPGDPSRFVRHDPGDAPSSGGVYLSWRTREVEITNPHPDVTLGVIHGSCIVPVPPSESRKLMLRDTIGELTMVVWGIDQDKAKRYGQDIAMRSAKRIEWQHSIPDDGRVKVDELPDTFPLRTQPR